MESIFIKQGIVIRVLLEKWRNYGIIDEKMPDLGRNDLQRNAGEKKMKKILDLITAEITQAFVDCGYDAKYGKVTPEALVESAMYHVSLLERHDFNDIVISIKSSNVPVVVEAYRQLSLRCDYPLHVGVTEAGTYRMGLIKSAMGIGTLLLEGIGDTIRVSLTDEPEKEVRAGFDILRAAGHFVPGPEVVSCPTCGRTNINVAQIASEVEERLRGCNKPIKVAVMGCVVNGPGEARGADIGIAGGKDCAMLFVRGQQVRMLRGNIVDELCEEIERLVLE